LVGVPEADGQGLLVADVRKAVPDEAGLLPEGLQHPVAGLVSELLKVARLDLVCCHPKVFHDASSSCSRWECMYRWTQRKRARACIAGTGTNPWCAILGMRPCGVHSSPFANGSRANSV